MPWDIQKNNYPSKCIFFTFFNLIFDAPRTHQIKGSPVIEEAPNHSARAIENIGHNGHPSKKMVIVDEGEAEGLGEVCNDALGELDSQEANPYL